MVVAAGQARLDQERAKLSSVEPETSGLLRQPGSADVNGRGVLDQLLLDAKPIPP